MKSLLLDLFRNSLCLRKQIIFRQIYQPILRAYLKVWSKNWMLKVPKIAVLMSKWSFERGLLYWSALFSLNCLCAQTWQATILPGYRQDCLDWKVRSADVITKEKWKRLHTTQIMGRLESILSNNIYVRAEANYGDIDKGRKSFDEEDRAGLVSFSQKGWLKADTKGHTYDASAALGYRLSCLCDDMELFPLIGYACSFQNLTDRNYEDSLYPFNFFKNSKSHYSYRWHGPWIGLNIAYRFKHLLGYAEYQYHWVHYYAKIKDNFIDNLRESQKNHAVHGQKLTLGIDIPLHKAWFFGLRGDCLVFQGSNGRHRMQSQNHSLKKIRWSSASISLSLSTLFY